MMVFALPSSRQESLKQEMKLQLKREEKKNGRDVGR